MTKSDKIVKSDIVVNSLILTIFLHFSSSYNTESQKRDCRAKLCSLCDGNLKSSKLQFSIYLVVAILKETLHFFQAHCNPAYSYYS